MQKQEEQKKSEDCSNANDTQRGKKVYTDQFLISQQHWESFQPYTARTAESQKPVIGNPQPVLQMIPNTLRQF